MTRMPRTFLIAALVVILAGGVVRAASHHRSGRPHPRGGLLREHQRHLRRRLHQHRRGARRADRVDRAAARVCQVSFWYDSKYKVPADVKAAILSPTLVTARSIQLTPPTPTDPSCATTR